MNIEFNYLNLINETLIAKNEELESQIKSQFTPKNELPVLEAKKELLEKSLSNVSSS